MRIARRSLTALIFIIPLIILAIVGTYLVRRYYSSAERNLKYVVASEATQALGHEVTVGRVTLKGGYAYVDDVKVAEGKTLAERGAILTARQVILDFNLWKLLFEQREPEIPLFANVQVQDPVGHVARDRRGRWNFEDLFKPRPGAAKQRAVGRVELTNGILYYSDAAFPRNPKRPDVPFVARLHAVEGELLFYTNSVTSWNLAGRGDAQQFVSTKVVGTYEPDIQRLFIRVDANRLSLPVLARLLPPDTNATTGLVSGQTTLLRTPGMAGPLGMDLQADLRVDGATVTSTRLAEPVQNVNGVATVADGIVTLKADVGFAGSPLHVEGTVTGFEKPSLNGWATGSGVQLQRVLAALKLGDRIPALRQVAITANVRADVKGRLDNLDIRATGPARVRGTLPGGPVVPDEGNIQVAFSGPLDSPRVLAHGTLPRVRFQKYEARNVWLSAFYTPERAAADFRGTVAGGQVTGRANLLPAGKRTSYAVTARGRGVNLAAVPLGKGLYAKGIADIDLIARGRMDQQMPSAVAEVKVAGAKLNGYEANLVRGRIRTAGNSIRLDPVTVRDEKGFLFVSGSANIRRKTLDLHAVGNSIDLGRIQRELAARTDDQPAQRPIDGLVVLRGGRITGTFDRPRLAGTVYGYNVRSDKYGVEYAKAEIVATEEAVTITSGSAYRFPAMASISGMIVRPLSDDRRLALRGGFQDLSIQDLIQLTDSELDVTGVAQGSFAVTGPANSPEVSMPDVRVRDARVGDFDFRSVTASVRYDPALENGTWFLDSFVAARERTNKQLADFTTVSGSGRINADQEFTTNLRVDRIDLDILAPYIADYVNLAGVGEAEAVGLRGAIRDGKVDNLAGTVRARTEGLTVNGVALGDIHGESLAQPAVFAVSSDVITSDNLMIGSRESGIYLVKADPARPAFVFNRQEETLRVNGEFRRIRVEELRQALAKSPYVANNPESVAARVVKPITDPIQGTLGGAFTVAGPVQKPTTDLAWFSQGGRVQGQQIDAFEGAVNFNADRVVLRNALLKAEETNVTASGTWLPYESITGTAAIHNLPMSLAQRWFPGRPFLRDFAGSIEDVTMDVFGEPTNPTVVGSALARDLAWVETKWPSPTDPGTPPDPTAAPSTPPRTPVTRIDRSGRPVLVEPTGREFHVRNIEVARFVVNDPLLPDTLQVEEVRATFQEKAALAGQSTVPPPNVVGPPAPAPPADQLATLRIYASGQSDFSWNNLEVLKNPDVRFNVRIPEQRLAAVAAVFPNTRPDASREKNLDGTIRASLDWTGTLREPHIEGNAVVQASRLRFGDRPTTVRDLLADLRFTGDTMTVAQFSAKTEVVDPRTGKVLRTSEPITLSGDLALHEGVAGTHALRLQAPNIQYADTALAGIPNAKVAIEQLAADLTVSGAVAKPHIAGRVDIAKSDIRLPSGLAEGGRPTVPPILPSFDVDFFVNNDVRIAASQLTAVVRTPTDEPVHLGGSLADGDVRNLRFDGALEITKGTLVFPTARFKIQPGGTVALRYPQNVFGNLADPTLGINVDLTATTAITAPSAVDPSRVRRYTITVEARGPLNSEQPLQITDPNAVGAGPAIGRGLRLTFRADPPDLALSSAALQRRVTGLLGGETAIQGLFGRGNIGSVLSAQVTSSLSNVLFPELFERLGLAQALGFEELTLDVYQLNAFTLRVSRQIFGPVYASYWRRLTGSGATAGGSTLENAAWEFKLSYRFQPHFQFSWTTDDQRTNAYLLEGVFRF
jgi:hypothetical protein